MAANVNRSYAILNLIYLSLCALALSPSGDVNRPHYGASLFVQRANLFLTIRTLVSLIAEKKSYYVIVWESETIKPCTVNSY